MRSYLTYDEFSRTLVPAERLRERSRLWHETQLRLLGEHNRRQFDLDAKPARPLELVELT